MAESTHTDDLPIAPRQPRVADAVARLTSHAAWIRAGSPEPRDFSRVPEAIDLVLAELTWLSVAYDKLIGGEESPHG